jgi:hypothetical protein
MSDWQKDFTEIWDAVAQLAEDVNVAVLEAVEEIGAAIAMEIESIDADVKEMQEELLRADWWDELLANPSQLFDLFDDSETGEDWPIYYEPRQSATETFQPACRGCRNYNGTTFGGNLLVCGFHPYGWDGETCPDWEQQ